jgi:hypothetical protein
MKVRSLITDALMGLGVIDPYQDIDAGDGAIALRVLNRMIDSWANDELMIYTVDRQVFNLVNAQQSYTIGIGGNFNTTYPVRPGQINMVSVLVNGVEIPIDVLNDEQWRDVTLKATSSSFPLQMWANGNYPLNTVFFWPVPTQTNQVVFYVWSQLSAFAGLDDDVNLPPGYQDLIVSHLELMMAGTYGKQPNPVTVQLAQSTKAKIKGMNWEPTFRSVDTALSGAMTSIGQRSRGYVID